MDDYIETWHKGIYDQCNVLALDKIYPLYYQDHIKLEDVYISQNTINNAKIGIGRYISNSQTSDPKKNENIILLERKISEVSSNRIAILGDLGSGKTTFINYLAQLISKTKYNANQSSSPFVKKFYNKFVICASLKDISLKKEISEDEFVKIAIKKTVQKIYRKNEAEYFLENFRDLAKDGMLFFLDGFDEVDSNSRDIIKIIIDEICKDPDNIVIITSRTYMYEANHHYFDDFCPLRIEPFNKDQISEYVQKWVTLYNSQRDLDFGNQLSDSTILSEVFQKDYLSELSGVPLFLTLLLLLYTDKQERQSKEVGFPVNRTILYREIIDLLLQRWNDSSTDFVTIEQVLEEAAYNDLKKNSSSDLFPELCASFLRAKSSINIEETVDSLADKTGILVRTGFKEYSFLHRSFQEYFAAGYIINNEDSVKIIFENLSSFERWKVCDVFIISRLGIEKLYFALAIINFLVPNVSKNDKNYDVHSLCIASEALIEIIQLHTDKDQETRTTKDKIISRLVSLVDDTKIKYQMRFKIGDLLSRLGDPRRGVGIMISNNCSYPDIDWIKIPGGEFDVGTQESRYNPPRKAEFKDYYISKYPITNSQYAVFIQDNGYYNKEYWTEEGWNWLQGEDHPYFQSMQDERYSEDRECQYRNWLSSRTIEKRKLPYWWNEEPWNLSNRPVVGITWYEACAFCNWLDKKNNWKNSNYKLPDDVSIILPSLEEWEHAARGPKSFVYPWGNNIQSNKIRANLAVSNLNQTSPVGMFPECKSKYGMCDAAGNVYEWILTGIEKKFLKGEALENNIEKSIDRIVKGGAWNFEYQRAMCAFVEWDFPIIFDQNTGFRPIAKKR